MSDEEANRPLGKAERAFEDRRKEQPQVPKVALSC
jgi:hypothetical protein